MADLAKESGHWYYPDGRPCYEVAMKTKSGMRSTTIRDARIIGLAPGVTTIIKCAAAPGLEAWKQRQVLMAALTLPRIDGETDEMLVERILEDSGEQAKKAAEAGTKLHAAVEAGLRGEWVDPQFVGTVAIAREGLESWFGPQLWLPEKSFCFNGMYGGKVDIHSPKVLLDIKSKDGDLAGEKLWDSHFMQLAAYGRGLRLPDDARYGILFVSRTHPEAVRLLEADPVEIIRGWRMFESLLAYWKVKNGFV